MKTLFGILLLLFVAASVTLIAYRNPGYVLITREPYVLETSLAVFLLIASAVFTVLYFCVRLLVRIVHAPRSLTRWRQTRRTRKAREAFLSGLTHLFSGEWIKAEKELLASLHAADSPFLGYLAAALAAQGQGDTDKRDHYLSQAHQLGSANTLATEITQTQLQLLAGQNEQALATLARVQANHPEQAQSVRLLIETYRRLRDWQNLGRLLPEARQRRLLPEAELDSLERTTQRKLLSLPLPDGALDTLHQAWSEVPESARRHPDMIFVYARQLINQNAMDECTALLATALERQWDERLVRLYGEAHDTQPAAQLETAEEWLTRHGESPALLLTLGRLARRNRLADRARGYLEKSIALGATADAHAELGLVFEEAGDSSRALTHCRQALDLCLQQRQQPFLSHQYRTASEANRANDYGY
jgi:HemY protein